MQVAVVALLLALLLGRWLATATAEALWAEALGVAATHALIRRLQTLLFLTAFSGAAVWCLGNLYLVYRAIGSVHVPRRLGNLEILEAVPRRYLLIAAVAVGLLLAIAFSHRADGWWYARALAGYRVSLGATDPVLGRDLGFYLYQLPWSRTVHSFVTLLSGVMLALIGLLYTAVGAVRWTGRRLRVGDLARWHLAGLLAAFALALFWGYRLEPVEHVAGIHGVPSDTVLTTVRLPVASALSLLALVAAVLSVLWVRFSRVAVVAVPWIVLASVSFVGHYVVPTFAAAVRTPEELALESVEAQRDPMAAIAFDARPPTVRLALAAAADPYAARRHANALATAPLWDGFAVGVLLNRTVGAEPPARFGDATLGLYAAPDGRPVPVYVAARAVDPATIPREELSWEAVHQGPYSAAAGAAAIQAHRVAPAGLPYFVPHLGRADSGVSRVTELALARRQVRFRPGALDFAVIAPDPVPVVGTPAGGVWRRMALAWTLQSSRIVTSDLVTDRSLIVWHRDVLERLNRYAPFAAFSDARAVVAHDTLYWLASGLVWAQAFPLAPTVRWRGDAVRYLRSSLIGVVEAATGRTAVYLTRDPDPLTAAWAALAPEIVRPAGELPEGLQSHLAYPQELFGVQVALLRARGDGVGDRQARLAAGAPYPVDQAPYWWVGTTPSDSVIRLRLMAALTVPTEGALAGIVDGTMRDGAPRLVHLAVEPALGAPGPAQAARQLGRLRADPEGIRGRLRMAPFDDGVLALQTSYVSPGESAAPQLVDVAVGWGSAAGSGADLRTALTRLRTAPAPFGMAPTEKEEARRWFERMDAARRSGDWVAFGRAYEELRRILTTARDTLP
ncbi:MAG: UPF0182 family protein [Gemmatimonadota bacterium]|nr:MAG: UPF0182 family protein [Gemmatimonadota bacterium]